MYCVAHWKGLLLLFLHLLTWTILKQVEYRISYFRFPRATNGLGVKKDAFPLHFKPLFTGREVWGGGGSAVFHLLYCIIILQVTGAQLQNKKTCKNFFLKKRRRTQ